jgi:hypothetical protein
MAIEDVAAKEAVDAAAKAAQGPEYGWEQDFDPEGGIPPDAARQPDAELMRNALNTVAPENVNFTEEFAKFSTEFSKFSNEFAEANIRRESKWESPDFVSKVKEQLQRVTKLVEGLKDNPDVGQMDLMRIQYEIMQMSVILDVSSKVGDKASQAVQSMFRNQ